MSDFEIDRTVFGELRVSVGADYLEELLVVFMEEVPALIAQLQPALDAGDGGAFRRTAHSIKSNAATFGATQLSELARELESMAREGRLGEIGTRLDVLKEAFEHTARALKELCA